MTKRPFTQVFKPSFGEEELEALREPIETGWISLGPKTARFEEEFADYAGAVCRGVKSATTALHLACLALGISPSTTICLSSRMLLMPVERNIGDSVLEGTRGATTYASVFTR
jgi:dTDP-4-amino-4,6-dideoxygalactose transaminase